MYVLKREHKYWRCGRFVKDINHAQSFSYNKAKALADKLERMGVRTTITLM